MEFLVHRDKVGGAYATLSGIGIQTWLNTYTKLAWMVRLDLLMDLNTWILILGHEFQWLEEVMVFEAG